MGGTSARPIPTGVVTFLFTDVEGSTRLWAADAEAMAASLRAHDEILRSAIGSHGGYVFATGGDAFCAAFQSVSAGAAAAEAAQAALSAAQWPGPALVVRMGLHLGEAEERGGDYFGPSVNTCARVAAAGHGRQILVTDAVAAAVDVAVADLGEHRLRDLAEPRHLYQIGDAEFPPLRSLDTARTTLPATRNTLIGREAELEELQRLLAEHRLVAITGVGGCGKTRLAVELGWNEALRGDRSVFFCDLTTVQDDRQVDETVMVALGMTARPDVTPRAQVVDFVGETADWLIIDNCEHVLDGAADLAEAVLSGCPNARLVVTSREALAVEGERPWRIPSMAVGENAAAFKLFVERALAASPTFQPGDQSDVVTEICAQLDGIPLAIELAAARTTSLGLVELRDRLDDRFRLLSGGRRRRQQRQHTLEEVIDWSYDLLDPDEQEVLRRLAVFSGGFDVDDVGPVVGIDDYDAFEIVDALVAKSLVDTAVGEGGRVRHRLLETLRLYGLQRLRDAGELEATRSAHLAHFAGIAFEAPEVQFGDADGMHDLSIRLGRNHENFRSALLWAEETERRTEMAMLAALLMPRLAQESVEGALPWLDISDVSEPRHLAGVAYAINQSHQARRDIDALFASAEELRDVPGMPGAAQRFFELVLATPVHQLDLSSALDRIDELERLGLSEVGYELLIRSAADYQRTGTLLALGDADGAADVARRMIGAIGGGQMAWLAAVAFALAGRKDDLAAIEVDRVAGMMDPARWTEELVDVVAALVALGPEAAARRLIDLLDDDFLRGQPYGYADVVALWGWLALEDGDLERARRLLRKGSLTGGVEGAMAHLLARAEGWPTEEFATRRAERVARRWSEEFASRQGEWPQICADETAYWRTR